ncbi:hypothetical protein EW026_g8245, partial [Hermanssonia centrifuga]
MAASLQSPMAQQCKLLHSLQGEEDSFDVWVESLKATNALLVGTTVLFTEKCLWEHIESHAFEELRSLMETAEVIALANFQEFKETLSDANSKHCIDWNHCKREIESFITLRAHFTTPAVSSHTSSNSAKPLTGGASAGSSANIHHTVALPKLTNGERKLLEQSKGCLKCRKVNAGHFVKNCPDGFPDASTYRDLVTGKVAITPIAEIDAIDTDVFQIPYVAAVQGTSSMPSCVLTSDDNDWDSD